MNEVTEDPTRDVKTWTIEKGECIRLGVLQHNSFDVVSKSFESIVE